jgi:hypothetical protein
MFHIQKPGEVGTVESCAANELHVSKLLEVAPTPAHIGPELGIRRRQVLLN